MSTSDQKINFYMSAYLKVNPYDLDMEKKENVEKIISKCSDKAYTDLQRRMPYKYSSESIKELEANKKEEFANLKSTFRNEVYGIILNNMVDKNGIIASESIHPRKMIKEVLELGNKHKLLFKDDEVFTVGLAQKWVNMTLKYMWILGVLDDEYEDKLEVPIDSYMIKAIMDEFKINMKHIKWSSWNDFEEYSKLQDNLYELLLERGYTRIGWENEYWIVESLIE